MKKGLLCILALLLLTACGEQTDQNETTRYETQSTNNTTQQHTHQYSRQTVEATCTQDGVITYTCDCGDTYEEPIKALGHNHKSQVVAPTCTQDGYTAYTCDCGDTYQAEPVKALGHSYTSQVVAPSGGTQGYTLHKCSRCAVSYKDNYIWGADMPTTFFDDAAFIGDSVTLALKNYCASSGALGKATFLCVGSYSVNNAVTNGLYLSYQGQNTTPQEALKKCGAKKVFIMLGMNDIALFGENSINKAIQNWTTMLGNIRKECPDIQIYIQSATPIYTAGQVGGLNNKRMDAYNAALKEFAQKNNCYYIDVATPMKDSTGGLASQYCSDNYVHLTQAACKLWVSTLKNQFGS